MLKSSEIPTIKSLRSFVSVAHHQSFSKAAKELHVTQGAVSKQITLLENMLGQALFERQINGIVLTPAGKQYLPKIMQALEIIQHASASLIQSDTTQEQLTIDVPPSFASLWLIDKVEEFRQIAPELQVKIRTREDTELKLAGEADIVLRCLPLSKHYEHSELIKRETLLLVGDVKTTCTDIESILSEHSLIPQTTRPQLWELFKSQYQCLDVSNYCQVGFEHFYLSLEAVKRGRGLALIPDFMLTKELEKGELVNPLGLSIKSGYGYYMSVPSYRLASRKVQLFHQWLVEQLA